MSSKPFDSAELAELEGGDTYGSIPRGLSDSARYGSHVRAPAEGPLATNGPASAQPPRRGGSSPPRRQLLGDAPPTALRQVSGGYTPSPPTNLRQVSGGYTSPLSARTGYAPPMSIASSKSSFVPPSLAASPESLRGSLKQIPTRSTRAFASRIKHSLVSIPENQTAASSALPPAGRGGRPKKGRPAPPKGGASTIAGVGKTVRLSVLPASLKEQQRQAPNSKLSFQPKNLIDIETGKSIVVTTQAFLDEGRYQELDPSGIVTARATVPIAKEDSLFFQERGTSLNDQIERGTVRDFEATNEVGMLGGAWRGVLKRLVLLSYDEMNGLRLTRQLQLFLPFQTGYEAYIIGQLIEAMDQNRKSDIRYVLNIAFRNRNVSRILVQAMGPRYDFLWHWHTAVTWNRFFDAWGQFPIVGITGFAATENFPSTRNHALASMFRVILGQGNWITRVITGGREGLVTDNPNNTAQNLAAESNGFELANRNQHGTYVGRRKTNDFRWDHRLPTDESLVRTFVGNPMPTMVNNGVVHMLRQLANHWHNMIYQFSGNFAHQRMEQLNPFEILRFHMPVVLLTLANLRGRNKWDARVLGPYIRKLQELNCSWSGETAKYLVSELKDKIIVPVSAGVASIVDPFMSWADAIRQSIDLIEEEAKKVYEIVTSVEVGIRLGHDLITQVSWKIPGDKELKKAILDHIKGLPVVSINERRIRSALTLVTPRDKRTLMELVKNGMADSKPAQLLLGRAKTLLQRELRRETLNETIRELSKGKEVTEFEHDNWYWVQGGVRSAVFIYDAKETGRDRHRFVHVDTKFEKFISVTDGAKKFYEYIPVAEAITRAQRAFMNIELDHGSKFIYDAFMEFSYLRVALRNLVVLSQVFCEELDNARLNVLAEIQRSNQAQIPLVDCQEGETYYTYNNVSKSFEPFVCQGTDDEWNQLGRTRIVKYPPQSMIVVGGGPTGLTTVIHCTENVLISGGVMKLYEARDAFAKGGATFERAQIVRLDARWIAMLRYHLGTGFEDVYMPASGETDSQLGNSLPTQGFVEITIKDLENMLHVEISKMWAKGLIQVYTDAKSNYDVTTNSLTKLGKNLNVEDSILRKFDEEGHPSSSYHSWRVVDLKYTEPVGLEALQVGNEYGVFIRQKNALLPYKLTCVDLTSDTYTFTPLKDGNVLKAPSSSLPTIYKKGTTRHAEAQKVICESVKKSSRGGYVRTELPMPVVRDEKFTLDVGHTHVVEAIGKPHSSNVHFSMTTYEPYGVCCIQGLKVSMGMHNFGEKRWGNGIIDDIRSQTDQNTRIIGDFTKMVRSAPVAVFMRNAITNKKDKNWQQHFQKIVADSAFPDLESFDPVVPKIQAACKDLAARADSFRRQTLQTRFFETGDNYYIGMEFTREYDAWKNKLCTDLVAPLFIKARDDEKMKKDIGRFKGVLMHHIDRLWYDGVLEVIREGDVYNPGARKRVPRLYTINSYEDMKLGSLPVGESFRLSDKPEEKYEVVIRNSGTVVVRNVEGYISKMKKSVKVRREGNLTRGPDGNQESKVSLATFPVGHYVNFRTMRLNDSEKGYVFAFVGDEQATPHFMRYSGLTGACINAMLLNNFIKQAVNGDSFIDRFRLYSVETNWSNGEVVQRGTTANYGDGFLRPGFPIAHGIDYMHSKVIEYRESDQDLDSILSRDWLIKMASSVVPRGMEMNEEFITALYAQVRTEVFEKFIREVNADDKIKTDGLEDALRERYRSMAGVRDSNDYNFFWNDFMDGLEIKDAVKNGLADPHVFIARRLDQMCIQIIEYSQQAYLYNERIGSQLLNQPKPVDSIVDDFAVEAQNFANALAQSAAFSSGALAFSLLGTTVGNIFATLVAALNIFIAFGTMTESARYKIRNEEARVIFKDEKLRAVMKGTFAVMDSSSRGEYSVDENPFVEDLEEKVQVFYKDLAYYDYEEPTEFKEAYSDLKERINDPEAIREFQRMLTTRFIVDIYHVNSYAQESLVNIYKILEDMHYLLTQEVDRRGNDAEAKKLFERLRRFQPRLEKSLQRGPTRWGFIKQRRITQWDCAAVFKFLVGLFCCSFRTGSPPFAPIGTETKSLLKQTRHVSNLYGKVVLRREARDLEALYYASNESNISSLIFMTGFLVFLASILFTVARIVDAAVNNSGSQTLVNAAFWATVPSTFGAILATFHFVRKFIILIKLWCTLAWKTRTARGSDDRERIRQVRKVTRTQLFLTIMRLTAAIAAAVALPWSIAENGFGDQISTNERLPFWIGLGAVGMAILSTLYFFIVEYSVRYNLDPKLGEYVCESFRDEIEDMYKVLENPPNDIDTKQVQERDAWEYVAREFLHKYRFDAVFAADRFGSILQYIQSGMDPRM